MGFWHIYAGAVGADGAAAVEGTTPDGLDFAALDHRPHFAASYWRPHFSLAGGGSASRSEAAEVDEDGFAEELEQGGLSLVE